MLELIVFITRHCLGLLRVLIPGGALIPGGDPQSVLRGFRLQDPAPADEAPLAPEVPPVSSTELADQVLGLLPEPVTEFWQLMETYPLISALGMIALSYGAAKIASIVLSRVIGKLTGKTRTELDDRLLELARKPVFFTVYLLGISLAIRLLHLPEGVTEFLIDALLTIIVLSWLGACLPGLRLVLDALGRYSERFPLIEERTIPLFDIASKLVVIGGATYALLAIWQLNPAPWFASAGVIGIAVGFAARDTLANLFAGIFIIADGPYKLGDFITLDSGERGLVTHVGVRSTRLLTRDDIEITLPNAVIANAKILNESGGRWPKERIRVKVGVAYGSDVDQVCETLKRIAERHDHICADPEPRVRMRAFGDSSLDFELLCWIDEPVLRGKLTHEMLMDVYKTFQKENIEIPFPQRDVWVRQLASPEREGDPSS